MNVLIRVDGFNAIGIGHFMRCFTLAEELRKVGFYTRFICRNLPFKLQELLSNNGHTFNLLNCNNSNITADTIKYFDWLRINQEDDAKESLKLISDLADLDWIIVDNYGLDYRWEVIVKEHTKKILVIDDSMERKHHCNIFLNQSLIEKDTTIYTDKLSAETIKLIGPKYALLGDVFLTARAKVNFRTGPIQRILISFGGGDTNNVTGKILTAIRSQKKLQFDVDVVLSHEHSFKEEIQMFCYKERYNCHIQSNKMADLMLMADLAIGAAGSTSWERCCLGLPSIVVSIAENQVAVARTIENIGVALYIGDGTTVNSKLITKALFELYHDREKLFSMSKQAFSVTDGNGKHLVLKEMLH